MRLEDIYKNSTPLTATAFTSKKPVLSFEVFPPRDYSSEKAQLIVEELIKLSKYDPKLVSVTYGAGGATKSNSLDLTKLIKNKLSIEVMPHLTCQNSSIDFIESYLCDIKDEGIENVLALRGDKPLHEEFKFDDFRYANELVSFIKSKTNLSIAVAGYPEGHSESISLSADIDNLKRKVDEGAQVIYTQLFFDNEYYYRYVDLLRKKQIFLPVVPGILPITSYSQLSRMIALCNVCLPKNLVKQLEANQDSTKAIKEIGIEHAILQSTKLVDYGVPGLHFYILNKSYPMMDILQNLV